MRPRSPLAVVFGALLLGGVTGVGACGKQARGGEASEGETPKLPVEVATLREEPLRDGAEYLGQLVSRHQVSIYPQVLGAVSAIMVKPGDHVKLGAPLLQIDARREAANLAQLQALRAQHAASLELSKRVEARSAGLLHEGLLSQQQYDQDKSLLEVAQQDLKAQDAAMAAQGVALGYYRIVAPFDGVVGDVPVKLGDLVSSQTKLTSVTDNASLEVYVNLPIEKLPLVDAASRVEVLDVAGKIVADAPVSFVAPETNPGVQSVLIKATIATVTLRAGQVVRARVVFHTHPGVRVPVSAISRLSGQYFVFVVGEGPKGPIVHKNPVTLGPVDDNRYDVVAGLAPGDRIALDQIQKLQDGGAIEPKTPGAAASTPAATPSSATSAP